MTPKEKSIAQALIRELAEAVRKKDKEEAARLKRELEDAGVLKDPTKAEAEK